MRLSNGDVLGRTTSDRSVKIDGKKAENAGCECAKTKGLREVSQRRSAALFHAQTLEGCKSDASRLSVTQTVTVRL